MHLYKEMSKIRWLNFKILKSLKLTPFTFSFAMHVSFLYFLPPIIISRCSPFGNFVSFSPPNSSLSSSCGETNLDFFVLLHFFSGGIFLQLLIFVLNFFLTNHDEEKKPCKSHHLRSSSNLKNDLS